MTHDTAVFTTSHRPRYAKRPPHSGLVQVPIWEPTVPGRVAVLNRAGHLPEVVSGDLEFKTFVRDAEYRSHDYVGRPYILTGTKLRVLIERFRRVSTLSAGWRGRFH